MTPAIGMRSTAEILNSQLKNASAACVAEHDRAVVEYADRGEEVPDGILDRIASLEARAGVLASLHMSAVPQPGRTEEEQQWDRINRLMRADAHRAGRRAQMMRKPNVPRRLPKTTPAAARAVELLASMLKRELAPLTESDRADVCELVADRLNATEMKARLAHSIAVLERRAAGGQRQSATGARRIDRAHRAYAKAVGTEQEPAAYACLRQEVACVQRTAPSTGGPDGLE